MKTRAPQASGATRTPAAAPTSRHTAAKASHEAGTLQSAVHASPRMTMQRQSIQAARRPASPRESGLAVPEAPAPAAVSAAPIQCTRTRFTGGKTRYASRTGGRIGSVYAQDPEHRENYGRRIRLMHKSGPHVSKRSSYRHGRGGVIRPLNAGQVNRRGERLVESRTVGGPISHTSRGSLGHMEPLNDEQAVALYKLARRSDRARPSRETYEGRPQAYEQAKAEHADEYNDRMWNLLLEDRFQDHELGREARALHESGYDGDDESD